MFILHSSDPCQTAYYYPIILIIIIILLILEFLTTCLKNKYDDVNSSFNNTLQQGVSYSATFIKRKNTLKLRYLIGYVLTRAAVWSKAPYLYTLYSTIHGFSMSEIGVLYIIDAVSATIGGPITGNLADIYGRRLFCQIYNILVVANLLLRMTGNKPLAYAAQILTGIGGGLINTTFESWVVFEANKEFTTSRNIEKDRFLKKLFKTQNILDAVMSIVISAICAIAYSLWGIFAPLIISIIFSIAAMIASQILWAENKPKEGSTTSMRGSFMEAFGEFKKKEVLCMGIIESLFQAVFNIYLFVWTPILQSSSQSGINVGFIFTCFVMTIIIGTKLYEIFLIYLRCESYIAIAVSLLIQAAVFFFIYYVDSFLVRFILLACINSCSGFFCPVNSIIKSKILVEKHRATLMSIFRIPLNIYVIIVLVSIRYLDPFKVCLIASGMITISFFTALTLVIWKPETENHSQ